ncbi:MAG TPA: hypothetical protein VI504_01585 [Candidatus Eisenbacteria bacterium]|jgi:hypothetical protein
MRRLACPVALLLLLACSATIASAQSGPSPGTGGVTTTLLPDNGGPAPAPALRSLAGTELLAARRWLVGSTTLLAQPATPRPAFRARRTNLHRNPVWAP